MDELLEQAKDFFDYHDLWCYEELMDSDNGVRTRPTVCPPCITKKLDRQNNKTTLFNPLRLEHIAVVATLRSFDEFKPSETNDSSYQAFKKIAESKSARNYLISYDSYLYGQLSEIVKIIDKYYSRGFSTPDNFFWAEPICCCSLIEICVSSGYGGCPNKVPFKQRKRFHSARYGHRLNNTPCCCDGYRSSHCHRKGYMDLCIKY